MQHGLYLLIPRSIFTKDARFINMDGKSTYLQLSGYFSCIKRLSCLHRLRLQQALLFIHFYVMAYHTVSHYPRYELDFKDIKRNLVATRELVLFWYSLAYCFFEKCPIVIRWKAFDLAIYGFLLLFILFVFVLGHQKKEWKLPSWLNLFTFLNGMLGNFLLFSSFMLAYCTD